MKKKSNRLIAVMTIVVLIAIALFVYVYFSINIIPSSTSTTGEISNVNSIGQAYNVLDQQLDIQTSNISISDIQSSLQ